MRTKILKFGMPLMAFLLAVVFAFATNGKQTTSKDLVIGYITSECTPVNHGCQDNGSNLCTSTVGNNTVFKSDCITPWMRL